MAYFDPNFHSLEEYIVPPPTVSVDNDTYPDRTVVMVTGMNRPGILVDIVQALTDLDLIISKSNISAYGDWIMDAFHVTDELGNKLTEPAQIRYIQDSLLFAERRGGETCRPPEEVKTCNNNLVGAGHLASGHAVLEMTVGCADHPGLLSEVLATLLDFCFEVISAVAWTHNGRAGYFFCMMDGQRQISSDTTRLAELEAQLRRVVEAHYYRGFERWKLRISGPLSDRAQAERRLHQMMREDDGWEGMADKTLKSSAVVTAVEMDVSVNNVKKKHNYMVEATVRSKDRPKLLYDAACTLEDLNYDVVHASVSTEETTVVQEFYIKKRDGCSRVTEMERRRLIECLMAATERRPGPWGMRLEVQVVEYRNSLLWEITKVLRENGMLVVGAKWAKQGDLAVGIFYVEGQPSDGDVAGGLMKALRGEIGGCSFVIKDDG